ncbi:MAG: hypothetical protein NPIRA01_40670 [Nitrospirales bacterium]|nr:MAG: hypothetical protein NPIRA01_40670 [Nitrospirales bacterium]
MRNRFYLYFSKHNPLDQHLNKLIRAIPEKQRNHVIKHILLDALSAKSRLTKSSKTSRLSPLASHQPTRLHEVSQDPLVDTPEKPTDSHPSNPLTHLQQALNKIPLQSKNRE